jgi:hypothetical protein
MPGLKALAIAGMVGVAFACGPFGASPKVCDPAARTTVLDAKLAEWTPSADFTVNPKTTLWITLTVLPVTYGGLFGDIGPVADLHPIPAGAQPKIVTDSRGDVSSNDPIIELQYDQKFDPISIAPGTWQIYANNDPGILLVACPAG